MSDKDNFSFFGFPGNDEIEIPDAQPNKFNEAAEFRNFMKNLSTLDADSLKGQLPKEALEELEALAKQNSTTIESLLSGATNAAQVMFSGSPEDLMRFVDSMVASVFGEELDDEEEECDCEDCDDPCSHSYHELTDIKYLVPETFGSVECEEDPELYTHFLEKYGTDGTKYLEDGVGMTECSLTEITARLPLQSVKTFKLVEANQRFIIFYIEPTIEDTFGFFVAVYKTPDGDFGIYIPEFNNTFKLENGVVSLYNAKENPELFTIDSNGLPVFKNISIPAIELATNFVLAPKKKTLLNVHQFGTIKNTMPIIKDDAMFLKVGNIISNESPEAILLKKDAELNLNETTFPLYFNFGRVVSKESLHEMAQIFFKVDFNECPLLENAELKYTRDGELYVDIDLGEF